MRNTLILFAVYNGFCIIRMLVTSAIIECINEPGAWFKYQLALRDYTNLIEVVLLVIITVRLFKLKTPHYIFTIYCSVVVSFYLMSIFHFFWRLYFGLKVRRILKRYYEASDDTIADKDLMRRYLESKAKRFNGKETENCPICIEEIKVEGEIIEMNCSEKHIFHKECILDWFD